MSTVFRRHPPVRVPATFADADGELSSVLHSLEGAVNYLNWLVALFAPHVRGDLAEIGAGTGTITEALIPHCSNVVAVEPSHDAHAILDARFADDSSVRVIRGDHTELPDQSADSIVLSNVLEHIEDDARTLRDLHEVLRPGGTLIVFSPAFEALYSEFDRKVGHYRRYRRQELVDRFEAAGFDIVEARYANALGGLAWFVYARLLKRKPTADGALSAWDRFVIPVIRFVEMRIRIPFGQSVMVVGRRPA